MFNNRSIIMHLAHPSESPSSTICRQRVFSQPVLVQRMRSEDSIQFEADVLAPNELHKQLMQKRFSLPSLPTPEISPQEEKQLPLTPGEPQNPFAKVVQWAAARKAAQKMRRPAVWESHHVLNAIDRKDAETLMHIRDDAFDLLLHDTGLRETPLKYAMRVQPEMAIVLLGAFSRYINSLQDEDMANEKTRETLSSLRVDLQSAIRHGLANSQKDLIASFLQTLVMSQGDSWITNNVDTVQIALEAGPPGRPVHTAQMVVRRFTTRALKNADSITAVDDYITNAAGDLLMMAAWASACKSINAERLSIYAFARDDRVYRLFVEQLNSHLGELEYAIPGKLRRQLELLREGMQGRRLSNKQKLEALAKDMDETKHNHFQTVA